MARRRRQEEQVSHDRWVVSYADFITILFAFFVVMYSISSVNEGKYRVLSDSLGTAFGGSDYSMELSRRSMLASAAAPGATEEADNSIIIPLMPDQRGQEQVDSEEGGTEADNKERDQSFSEQVLNKAEDEIDGIATDVEHEMVELIDDDILNVKRNKFWLEVEVKTSLLFPSGSSKLLPDSIPVLVKLSDIFATLPNRIHVEGFTDNRPINTEKFPSNWELSAARAAAVVRLFESNGVDPSRMASIGYGEYHPVADNGSEKGRAQNRRVVMIVMASREGQKDDRFYEFELLQGQNEVPDDG